MPAEPETFVVNVRELLVMLFEMRVSEHADPAFRRRLGRLQERARGALAAEALAAEPRQLDQVLWTIFRGPELAWRLQVHGYGAIGWLLEEGAGAPSRRPAFTRSSFRRASRLLGRRRRSRRTAPSARAPHAGALPLVSCTRRRP